jgi:hypothetical protein
MRRGPTDAEVKRMTDARDARAARSESLQGERQKQANIDMGLSIAASMALTAPLGLVSGTAVGVGSEYAIKAALDDPALQRAVSNMLRIIPTRSGTSQVSLEDQRRAAQQTRDFQSAARHRLAIVRPTIDKYAALNARQTQSAIATPITYVSPSINRIAQVDNSAIIAAQNERAAYNRVLTAQAQTAIEEQKSDAEAAYYRAVQQRAAQQQEARQRLMADVQRQMATIQTVVPIEQRRLPPVISSQGEVVGNR